MLREIMPFTPSDNPSTNFIWVDDLLEMCDLHPHPFLIPPSCIFFPLKLYALFWQKQPSIVPEFPLCECWMPHFNSGILKDSSINSQTISWPVAHIASKTTLCVLGGFLRVHMYTHTHAHTDTHQNNLLQIFRDRKA